jgi:CRP-like cAMP-binding protein
MPEQRASRLLDGLGEIELEAIDGDLGRVKLEPGRTLVSAHETIRRVYFPESGLIALSLMLPDGRTAGVTLVGNEGIAGLSAATGVPEVTDAVVQVPGTARVMSAEAFRAAIRTSDAFRAAVAAYTVALHAHLAQTVACNRLHGLDQRAARWLLLAHDRTAGDSFPLTQEAFADLLGVSRPAVSTVGARFARGGSVEFRRGTVHIIDVSRLERSSCECLEADRDAFRVVPLRAPIATRGLVERVAGRRPLGIVRPEIRRAR